jgi:DNA processing protein
VRLSPDDLGYPVRLSNLSPKRTLTTSGPLDHSGKSVAIVGSRHPTPEALAFTRDLSRGLAAAGVLVISGGALGIDAAAHEGALANGATWCVAPNGRGRPYPPENAALFDRVSASQRSRMIWPFPDGQSKTNATPTQRNAILVALARVVVVVQAHFQSGSRNAIKHARDLGRPIFIVPAAPWMPSFAGSNYELTRGGAWMLAHPSQLFRFLGVPWPGPGDGWPSGFKQRSSSENLDPEESPRTAPDPEGWTADESSIYSALSATPQHVDEVVARTGLRTSTTITALLTLSLKDVVVESPDGFFRRR